MVHNSLKTANN